MSYVRPKNVPEVKYAREPVFEDEVTGFIRGFDSAALPLNLARPDARRFLERVDEAQRWHAADAESVSVLG